MMDFELHPRLAQDCRILGDLPLSRLLGIDDAQFPWCILVPRRPGIREIHELPSPDQQQLLSESCSLGKVMMEAFFAEKLNVAALGNLVPQLHVHHIARFSSDACWPNPVWGRLPAQPYTDAAWADFSGRIASGLTDLRPVA